ncbi:phage scaffolding protein [Paenibacillus xanthanilyticus]|uniref:Scaffolding protein n=1 Tax=Paenibacillus xanthanilyticus TaxID=1783531 RepID=A0ABV8KCK6_9BACL
MINEIKRKFPLVLDMQLFAEGDDDGGDDTKPDPEPPVKKVEMTQAELDALIAREKGRVKSKYADYDDVKTQLAAFKEAEEERKKADMSEKERLEAEKADALKRAEDAATERDKALTAANQRLIKAEFRALARELGVRADALDDAFTLADLSAVKVDDEGAIEGVKDVVEALLKNKPFLAGQTKPREIGDNKGPEDKPDKTKEQLLAAAAEKARRTGRIEDRMAYSALKEQLNK